MFSLLCAARSRLLVVWCAVGILQRQKACAWGRETGLAVSYSIDYFDTKTDVITHFLHITAFLQQLSK